MSNALITTAQLPAHLQGLMQNTSLAALNQDAAKGIGVGSWPRISLKGGRFRLQDPQGQEIVVPDYFLDVVIVGVNSHGLSKIYYAGNYDPTSDGTAPDCYSDNGVAPSARASKPQCSTCAACPLNVWGSKVTPASAQVKACADIKKLAVLIANNTSGPVFELRVPAASLSNLGAYVRGLDAAGIPAAAVVTRLTFDTQADYPKLIFSTPVMQEGQTPYITAEMYADVQEVINDKTEINQCIGENDKPFEGKVAASATTVIAQNPGQPVYGPPRAPLQTAPAPAYAPPQPTPNFGAPAANGPIAHPGGPAPAPEATPKPRRGRKAAAPAAAPAQPSLPLQPAQGSIVGGMPIPPGQPSARDAAAPLNPPVTDAAFDDLLSRAMSV